MTLIIDPKSISVSKIISDLETFLASKPDADLFNPFFSTATGKSLVEMIAGFGAFNAYNNIVGRRENFIQFAINRSSLVGGSENLGVSVPRGSNRHLSLTVTPNQTTVLPRFSIIGAVGDKDIILLEDTPVSEGTQVSLNVVVGEKETETLVVPNDDIQRFRFTSADVSEDIRLLLNGQEVTISSKLEDMIEDKFSVLSNPLGSVDVFSLNKSTSPIRYNTGDSLVLEFVKLKDFQIQLKDMSFFFGSIQSFLTSKEFIDRESEKAIQVNSPLLHETQARIRGRLDFKKLFLGLDTRIVDTNQKDISPAVVDLVYVRSDNELFTSEEKEVFQEDLQKRILMGIEPPPISDPIRVPLTLNFVLSLLSGDGDPENAVEEVVANLRNKLSQEINLLNIESQVEKSETVEGSGIRFVETARVSINSETWSPVEKYQRGFFVNPSNPNGLIYELSEVVKKTGESEPEWAIQDGQKIYDHDILWECLPVDLCVQIFTWTANSKKVLGDYVVPTVPNGKMYKAVSFVNRSFGNQEIQKIDFSAIPNAGTWRIHFGEEKTTDLAFNASNLEVQDALRNLNALSDVEVLGDYTEGFTINFVGADSDVSQPEIEISNEGQNEAQIVSFSEVPNGGDWGLQFEGLNTTILSPTSTASEVRSALLALPNINDCIVTGDFANGFVIEFTGTSGKKDQPLLIQFVESDLGQNEIQKIEFSSVPDSGTFRLHIEDVFTSNLPFNSPSNLIQSELSGLGYETSVSGDFGSGFDIEFTGPSGKKDQPLIEIANGGRNEIQKIIFSTTPDQGTFRLEFDGEETSDIPFNSSNAQIETFLEALPNINSVSVTGDFVSGLQIEFTGSDTLQPKPLITLNDLGLDEVQRLAFSSVPNAGTFSLTFQGQTTEPINYTNGVSEIQKIDFTNVPNSGSFTLTFEGEQTIPIAFNAQASTVKSALEALAAIDVVTVTGDFASGFQIEFLGDNINSDVSDIAVGANTLELGGSPVSIFASVTRDGEDGNADAIKSSLESLPNIDEVSVLGDFASGFSVTFTGGLVAKQDVSQLIIASNNLFTDTTPVNITPSTTTQGRFPAKNVRRLGELVAVTSSTVQGGLIPANQLLVGTTPVLITASEFVKGVQPTSNLDRNGSFVEITIEEAIKGELPANNLSNGPLSVEVNVSTLVNATDSEPDWANSLGGTTFDGQILWMAVEFNGTPPVWEPKKHYNLGDFAQSIEELLDASGTKLMHQAVGFLGTSASVEPIWPTEGSVTDGDICGLHKTQTKIQEKLTSMSII